MGYTKLFESLVRSSIWDEDDKTRIVWVTMLALKDRRHQVTGTVRWLAREARVDEEACEAALKRFESPDKHSQSREFEGRRVKRVEGGWLILNGEKYRAMMSLEERNEYKRRWMEDKRRGKAPKVVGGTLAERVAVREAAGRSPRRPSAPVGPPGELAIDTSGPDDTGQTRQAAQAPAADVGAKLDSPPKCTPAAGKGPAASQGPAQTAVVADGKSDPTLYDGWK